MTWSEKKVKKLSELWSQGLTATKIAEALDGAFTRNAIIGKANRLGLKKGTVSNTKTAQSKDKQKTKTAAKETAKKSEKSVQSKKVQEKKVSKAEKSDKKTANAKISKKPSKNKDSAFQKVMDFDNEKRRLWNSCQWPEGDPDKDDFHICQKEVVKDRTYCPEHLARAYSKAKPQI